MSSLLTVTQAAADALDTIVASTQGAPQGAGVRVVETASTPEGATTFGLQVVAQPEPSDQVVDTGQTPVFVEPDAAVALDDKVLDATIAGDRVGFTINEH